MPTRLLSNPERRYLISLGVMSRRSSKCVELLYNTSMYFGELIDGSSIEQLVKASGLFWSRIWM